METTEQWSIEARPWDDPAGVALREEQRVELDTRYGGNFEPGKLPSAADIDLFIVAFVPTSGEPLGCGALRRLDGQSAEIKRMYVVPPARGTGVATALLRTLETAAVERGWTTIRLETGTEQPDAQRFYQREGYHEIPLFGAYVGSDVSLCYERRLK